MAELWTTPVYVAKKIQGDGHRFRWAQGLWYRWEGTHYAQLEYPEGVIDALIEAQFDTIWQLKAAAVGDGPLPPRKPVSDALLRGVMRKLRHAVACDGQQPAGMVSFRNGVLDVEAGTLLPHSPDRFLVGRPVCDYDPEAQCPAWRAFLDQVLPEEAAQQLLQRWAGLCMTADTGQQKALMLTGASRAGKGIIARILAALVGHDRTASIRLMSLVGDHGLSPLLGRSLAIVDETSLDFRSDRGSVVSTLLSIIGETPVAINQKYQAIMPFVRLGVRFVFTTNNTVNFGDHAGAMGNRLLFLHFPKSWVGKEDTRLYDRLHAELPGITVWALQGLRALRASGWPKDVASAREAVEESRATNNPVLRYVEECLEFGEGHSVAKDAMYSSYRSWCIRSGLSHPLPAHEFAKRILAAHPGRVAAARVQDTGRRTQQWTGVKILPDA